MPPGISLSLSAGAIARHPVLLPVELAVRRASRDKLVGQAKSQTYFSWTEHAQLFFFMHTKYGDA